MKNTPVLSYLRRNYALLLAFVVSFLLFRWDALFQAAGPMIYIPVMFLDAVLIATIVRHFFWRHTADEFANRGEDGGFREAWWVSINAAERVRWTIGITLGLIYCASLVAAALAK